MAQKQNKISEAASLLGRLGGLATGKCKARPSDHILRSTILPAPDLQAEKQQAAAVKAHLNAAATR